MPIAQKVLRMDLEPILPFALVFISILSFQLGGFVRERVHVLLPWKDPVTIMLMVCALWPVIASAIGRPDIGLVDPGNRWYLAALAGFAVCYCLAYIKTEFSTEYIDIHTIRSESMPYGGDEIKNIVYYRNFNDGKLYLQEQTFKEILKTMIFKVRSPLNFPLGQIQRRRDVYVSKVLLPRIYISVVDVAVETVTEDEVKVGPFTFTRRSYKYDPEPSCMANCTAWLANAMSLQIAQVELIRKETELIIMQAKNQTETIANGVNLVKGLIDASDISQETIRETIEDLSPEHPMEMPETPKVVRKPTEEPQEPPEKKMKLFAKKDDEKEKAR